MLIEAVMAQVVALRAQLEALASTVEALRDEWPLPQEPTCPHSDVYDESTLAQKKLICKRCGQDVSEAFKG